MADKPLFLVVGRIPGCDDDEALLIRASGDQQAVEVFVKYLYTESGESKDEILSLYDNLVFLTQVQEVTEDLILDADEVLG